MRKHASQSIAFALTITLLIGGSGAANAVTPMVAAGGNHALAVQSDGTVLAWGSDSDGQLGLGRLVQSDTPVKVGGLQQVKAIATGDQHTLALKQDGTVWAWGWNAYGQLGDGTKVDRSAPVQVAGLTNVIAIDAGSYHSIALKQDGTVWVWGYDNAGQVSYTYKPTPQMVQGLASIKAIAAGGGHSLALKQDGTVWSWGSNTNGQVGSGTTVIQQTTPAALPGLTGVTAIAASANQSFAVKSDGSVRAWGWNQYGQLGDGSTTDRFSPVVVQGLAGVARIVAASWSTYALKQDGTLWAWGNNDYGQLGGTGGAAKYVPVQLAAQTGIADVSGGLNGFGPYAVSLKQNGTLLQWGYVVRNDVSGLSAVAGVSVGSNHAVAMMQDGTVWAWGYNDHGQLGDNGIVSYNVPVQVPGLTGIAKVAPGNDHTLALTSAGAVWAWGDNQNGQIGDGTQGTANTRSKPVLITGVTDVVAIGAGFGTSLAVKRDGTVWGWGNIHDKNVRYWSPVQVSGLTGITAVAVGINHILALKQDGTVWAWGRNDSGQLGDGTVSTFPNLERGTPAPVQGLSGVVVAIAAWGDSSFAVKQDGSVWSWGSNSIGKLGDGTTINRSTPVRVSGITGAIVALAGGWDGHSLALGADGSVWAWGQNNNGQLGDGTATVRSSPAKVPGITGAVGLAAGGSGDSFALKSDGSVLAWGYNGIGQLGDGTFAQRRSPVLVVSTSADGFLNLNAGTIIPVPPALNVPFFVVASGGITDSSASVSTATKFKAADVGKTGAVFVTAMVPEGTLGAAQSPMIARSAHARAGSTPTAFVLIQLTSSGWVPVVNGQLIAYATGVLGDQLSAQNILSNTDTTNLKGAEFCLGYGASAADMIAAGTMRVIATIPDPNATGVSTVSCIVAAPALSFTLLVPPGWNLLGNSLNQTLSVASLYGDPNSVTSVWKWDAANAAWQFYAPSMDAATLQTYATGKGYGVLSAINPGEGYWVNARVQPSLGTQSGASFALSAANLVAGWNLVATGNDVTPSAFNTSLKATAPGTGVNTLWAWDNSLSSWFFYAPSLEAQGGAALSNYITSKGYLDFTPSNKTLGKGTGFWVNR